ncbi:MAG: hypothetical protein ABR985_01115 [Methanotrichaceae archaeon]
MPGSVRKRKWMSSQARLRHLCHRDGLYLIIFMNVYNFYLKVSARRKYGPYPGFRGDIPA